MIEYGFVNRYFDMNGEEIFEGDYICFNSGYDNRPKRVYKWEDEYGSVGLGTDATNPALIESGRAHPCEFGVYPLTEDDLRTAVLAGRS